ncbi:MAG TPA: hypothetical protein HPP94_12860 [Desulfuromonadales bacterium]|nr:hypothetical protein [Desulfuromonadales bacterium]
MIHTINDILGKAGLAPVKAATLSIEKTETADWRQVQSRISSFGGAGWLCVTDKILLLPQVNGPLADMTILSGELSNGSASLHIRQSSSGWELYEMTRYDGGEQLMVEESFISTQDKDILLTYETYWKKGGSGAMEPFASRFAGFSDKGGTN